ncbi:MAG: SAM-dependent chlorinase/fluorinase [Alphaproteobacteria bacterium]|nr:SAM-dependent chlorinase/fluorinase [Alphaproteobacteria bacterium]MBF0250664.1 SAM-dependent chlorinase/fluorinase [Alphaproteobacteria bacterium]
MTRSFPPIVLFCDFGLPYTGQMKGRMAAEWGADAAWFPVVDLMHDVPAHDIRAGSILLAAHAGDFPEGCVFVCVVDPGVGTQSRKPGVVLAGGRWFVGPLNGLFEHVLRRWPEGARAWEISWRPPSLSASFHGRDLFSPIAARLARDGGAGLDGDLREVNARQAGNGDFPDDLAEIVYVDGFGNLMTGLRWATLGDGFTLQARGRALARARTFADVVEGSLLVYENAVGLAEISANRGNARKILEIGVGSGVKIIPETRD